MGGKTELSRVAGYVSEDVKQQFEAWADEESRSMSWLLGRLIEQGLEEYSHAKANQSLLKVYLPHNLKRKFETLAALMDKSSSAVAMELIEAWLAEKLGSQNQER